MNTNFVILMINNSRVEVNPGDPLAKGVVCASVI